jgi:hypothetical protein
MVLPALVLALTAPGTRADAEGDAHADLDTAGGAAQDEQVAVVARISAQVTKTYPRYQVAQVLPRPVPLAVPEGAQQFAVELVLPGRGTCWLHVALPGPGRPARVQDLPRAAHGCPSNARRSTPPVVRPPDRVVPLDRSRLGGG